MTFTRLYTRAGARAGVLAVSPAITGREARQVVHLPNSLNFQALWDKANEPPVELDKRL